MRRTDDLEQQLLLATQGNDSIATELRAVQMEKGELQVQTQGLVSTNREALGESQLLRHQTESLQQQVSVLQHDARQNQVCVGLVPTAHWHSHLSKGCGVMQCLAAGKRLLACLPTCHMNASQNNSILFINVSYSAQKHATTRSYLTAILQQWSLSMHAIIMSQSQQLASALSPHCRLTAHCQACKQQAISSIN